MTMIRKIAVMGLLAVMLVMGGAGAARAEPFITDQCDVWVFFGASKGGIDKETERRIQAYISSRRHYHRDDYYIWKIIRTNYGDRGEYDLCLYVWPKSADVLVYRDIKALIPARCSVGYTQVAYREDAYSCNGTID